MTTEGAPTRVERVQLGVRMEKRLAQVLKGLAEFEGVTLGQLLEKIARSGQGSLTDEERQFLKRVSARKRNTP